MVIGRTSGARAYERSCARGKNARVPASASARTTAVANTRLYLHETIHIVGTGSEAYKRHTGERRPSGPSGSLVGTWQQSGSTGDWPRVVNLWEMSGWDGWAEIL